MATYYTIEEKYLKAVNEVYYGNTPKALNILNGIIDNDPLYARAHYQLGKLYFYKMSDYQAAGFHFKTRMELEPAFPDNYFLYLNLVVFLGMEQHVLKVTEKALTVAGVDKAPMLELQGLHFEKRKDWSKAIATYKAALTEVTGKVQKQSKDESIARVKLKKNKKAGKYELTG